ncbi:MAG: 3-hydroxy-5-phosphonooxypentane-2,4-dione thiolase [Nitrospirae bacterium]|nr:3-hydroxy-5-phosphonooxypentane-2,4-dione thiolase [Nitrospirota bacterium]
MDWGMKNRMSAVFRPETGRAVMLAVDHGYFQGPTTGLESPRDVVAPLLPHADALMCTRGLLRNCVDPSTNAPVVLRVSGGPSVLKELSDEEITTSMQEAVRLNAVGVGMSIFVGSENERRNIVNLGRLVNEAEDWGMPVLAITAVGREMERDARYLGLCCRIAAEIGAHYVKTYFCKDFEKVVQGTPVPVVIAGGKKLPEREALELSYNAIQGGASGVDMGRNIFQSEHPVAMIRAVRAVVHQKATAKEAFDLYESLARGREEVAQLPKSRKAR